MEGLWRRYCGTVPEAFTNLRGAPVGRGKRTYEWERVDHVPEWWYDEGHIEKGWTLEGQYYYHRTTTVQPDPDGPDPFTLRFSDTWDPPLEELVDSMIELSRDPVEARTLRGLMATPDSRKLKFTHVARLRDALSPCECDLATTTEAVPVPFHPGVDMETRLRVFEWSMSVEEQAYHAPMHGLGGGACCALSVDSDGITSGEVHERLLHILWSLRHARRDVLPRIFRYLGSATATGVCRAVCRVWRRWGGTTHPLPDGGRRTTMSWDARVAAALSYRMAITEGEVDRTCVVPTPVRRRPKRRRVPHSYIFYPEERERADLILVERFAIRNLPIAAPTPCQFLARRCQDGFACIMAVRRAIRDDTPGEVAAVAEATHDARAMTHVSRLLLAASMVFGDLSGTTATGLADACLDVARETLGDIYGRAIEWSPGDRCTESPFPRRSPDSVASERELREVRSAADYLRRSLRSYLVCRERPEGTRVRACVVAAEMSLHDGGRFILAAYPLHHAAIDFLYKIDPYYIFEEYESDADPRGEYRPLAPFSFEPLELETGTA